MTRPTPRILAFGDNVVDCYRDTGQMYPGGNCLNHAVFARRFGAEVAYAGAVSDDAAGQAIRRALEAEGVDTTLVRTVAGQTAYCVIDTVQGERGFFGANLGVSIIAPGPADLEWMCGTDAVHTGRSSHIDAWLPRIAGLTRLSYDFSTIRDRARIRDIARHCHLAGFSGADLDRAGALELAGQAIGAGARWVIVTRGGEGALLVGAEEGLTEAGAEPVVPVDTLGAGDTFIARTLVGLLRGEEPAALLRQAALAAAQTCRQHGAFGHGAPMQLDLSRMMTIEQIYATTKPAPGPESGL